MYIGQLDISNAFYMLSLPEALRPYFGLPGIAAGAVGITSIRGRAVGPKEMLVPRVCVVPMGWTHALWWCQQLHERMAVSNGCNPGRRLSDKQRSPAVDQPENLAHLQYVDNYAVMGTDPVAVRENLLSMKGILESAGLPVHEVDECSNVCELLG